MEDDILVELSDSELQGLANMYESHKNQLPYLHSFLQNCLKAKKNGMSDFVTVYSPRNCWSDDGTFIASMPLYGHDIILHSLDPSGKNLLEGLTKNKKYKFFEDSVRNFTLFYGAHELFASKIMEALTDKTVDSDEVNFWCLEKEKAIKFDITPPGDVFVKQLAPEDIDVINSCWRYNYPTSEKKLLDWLKLGCGYGVYLKSNNQLVSFVTASAFGQLAALQTIDEHKKKGYATLVIKAMAKCLAENGFDSCGTIVTGNAPSEALFNKLGFRNKYKGFYIQIHGHDIVLHSLDPSGKNLIEGLTKTRSIKFNQDPARNYTLFFAVHELFYPKITKVLSEVLKHEIIVSEDINFWCLEREKAVQFDIPYSNDVYVKQLETSDIPTLNSYWGFNYPASEQKLLDCWKLCKGYGVYLKSSDQLVSWVASSCLGQTSALQTVDEHKKKGFASLAVMGMAKYLAEKGFDCCGTVLIGNTVSGGFFQRLGFERRFKGQYIGVLNKY